MAGLGVYLMDVCNWEDDALHRDQQSNGYQLFDKEHLRNVNIHKACASYIYMGTTSLRETPYLVWVLLNSDE